MSHTVLLVDDDAVILSGVRKMLQQEPYRILTARSPREALALLDEQPVDLVVSDYEMAEMTGLELLGEVRARFPQTVRIMMTSHSSGDVVMEAINRDEVFRFLSKPPRADELKMAIRQGLCQHDLVEESRGLQTTVRRQHAAMADLESEVRGITHVERDTTGAIVVDDAPADLDALIREMQAASGR